MGPMHPMQDMIGGGPWGGGTSAWIPLVALLLIVLMFALLIFGLRRLNEDTTQRRPHSPEEILRVRYADGELSRQQYQDALVDILKDRYMRDEIELHEYEDRLTRLLDEQHSSLRLGQGSAMAGTRRPVGPER